MQVEKIRLQDNVIEFNIDGEDHTLLNLLREQLSALPEVQFAAYKFLQHERPKFYVRTQPDENPIDVIAIASKKIVDSCKQLTKQIDKFKQQ